MCPWDGKGGSYTGSRDGEREGKKKEGEQVWALRACISWVVIWIDRSVDQLLNSQRP